MLQLKSKKRVLYALQGTGNGHVARAREIIPILEKHAFVDVWIGGTESEVLLPQKPKFIKRGFVMFYNKSGAVSYWKTLFGNNYYQIIKDVFQAPVKQYDIIINDFEFLTSWACYFRKVKFYQLSHQASFSFKETPRPHKKSFLGEVILRYYAPGGYKIGFHFERYHPNIFPPVIRSEIRNAEVINKKHITVYLPAFHHDYLIDIFTSLYKYKWHVFSKFTTKPFSHNNVHVYPVSTSQFLKSFLSCSGVFCGAGFETPAEAMFLGKKVAVMPIERQYEQYCNASALSQEGVTVINSFNTIGTKKLHKWLENQHIEKRSYPDYIEKLLVSLLNNTPISSL